MPNELVPAPDSALVAAAEAATAFAQNSKAANTRRAYGADWRHFSAWCERMKFPVLPAPPATVALYLGGLATNGLSAKTIVRRCTAIWHFHKEAGHDSPTEHAGVRATLDGIRRTLGTAPRKKAALTAELVAKAMKRIPSDLAGLRDRALILIGFAAALRRSELVALDLSDVARHPKGIVLTLRRSKTDQAGAGAIKAVPYGHKLKVVAALDAWIAAARIGDGALFRGVRGDRVLSSRLCDRQVARTVKKRAAQLVSIRRSSRGTRCARASSPVPATPAPRSRRSPSTPATPRSTPRSAMCRSPTRSAITAGKNFSDGCSPEFEARSVCARALVDGKSGRDAYCGAGYKPKSHAVADAAASRLLHDVKVAARIAELKAEIARALVDSQIMDLNEVLAELSKVGRANIQDIIVAGDDTSDVVQSLRDMKPEHAAAIQELTIETYTEGGGDNARDVKRVKVKLHPKHPALAELRAHHEPQRHLLGGIGGKPIETKDETEVPLNELARRVAFALVMAARSDAAANTAAAAAKPRGKQK